MADGSPPHKRNRHAGLPPAPSGGGAAGDESAAAVEGSDVFSSDDDEGEEGWVDPFAPRDEGVVGWEDPRDRDVFIADMKNAITALSKYEAVTIAAKADWTYQIFSDPIKNMLMGGHVIDWTKTTEEICTQTSNFAGYQLNNKRYDWFISNGKLGIPIVMAHDWAVFSNESRANTVRACRTVFFNLSLLVQRPGFSDEARYNDALTLMIMSTLATAARISMHGDDAWNKLFDNVDALEHTLRRLMFRFLDSWQEADVLNKIHYGDVKEFLNQLTLSYVGEGGGQSEALPSAADGVVSQYIV
jgi:hypothetical protein